jgi:hypothetical protein
MNYELARQDFVDTFHDDQYVLESIAHGHTVNVSSISDPPIFGEYNLMLPLGGEDELIAVENANGIIVECSDRRQSHGVYETITQDLRSNNVVTIAVAAGPDQPKKIQPERHNTMVNLLVAMTEVNPHATLFLIGHNQQCGGLNLMTDMYCHTQKGSADENIKINTYTDEMKKSLINRGVESSTIMTGLAVVDENDQYTGTRWF